MRLSGLTKKLLAAALMVVMAGAALPSPSRAEVLDRVVAFIDTEAITLSELDEMVSRTNRINPSVTRHEVLQTLINRILLLREAHRLRLEAKDEDTLLEQYIDLKIRAFIKVNESEMREIYETNREEFVPRGFADVKDEIEAYLREKEVNYRLRQLIEGLRQNTYIKVLPE